MKNEVTEGTSMYEKIDTVALPPDLRKQIIAALEGQLQDHTDDPKGQEALRIAIEKLKASMS